MHNLKDWVVVLDLDDTIFKERDYASSAYREISDIIEAKTGMPVKSQVEELLQLGDTKILDHLLKIEVIAKKFSKDYLLNLYRNHIPKIAMTDDTTQLVSTLNDKTTALGIITDGRSHTQRNKIKALGLDFIVDVLISEEVGHSKPSPYAFEFFQNKYPGKKYLYCADNLSKDFITPNKLGWKTVGLKDNGANIHQQNPSAWSADHQPHFWVNELSELLEILVR